MNYPIYEKDDCHWYKHISDNESMCVFFNRGSRIELYPFKMEKEDNVPSTETEFKEAYDKAKKIIESKL